MEPSLSQPPLPEHTEYLQRFAELEARLEAKIKELEQSNRDLEQFAYVASHDLLEPVRMVGSFAELLEAEYGDRLDGDGKLYLQHIREGAAKSRRLINDLLTFSRVGRSMNTECFNLREAVDAAAFVLQPAMQERGARLEIDDLPVVCVDRAMMERLFQNLIGNAVKFRRDDAAPVIRIYYTTVSSPEGDEQHVVTVEDNGEGFDPKYSQRIFGLFQRLKTTKTGTGIGLSICKKIVEFHGGRIWAESTPGVGTKFHFSLDKPRES